MCGMSSAASAVVVLGRGGGEGGREGWREGDVGRGGDRLLSYYIGSRHRLCILFVCEMGHSRMRTATWSLFKLLVKVVCV